MLQLPTNENQWLEFVLVRWVRSSDPLALEDDVKSLSYEINVFSFLRFII